MLNRLPKHPPGLDELLADLGHPCPVSVAKALDVSPSTVRRWKRTRAPKTALLALWWLSRWGQSAWDCEMHQRRAIGWTIETEHYTRPALQPSRQAGLSRRLTVAPS